MRTDEGRKAGYKKDQGANEGKQSEWVEVALDRPSYRPETCAAKPLRGYLIDRLVFQGDDGPYGKYLFKTTQPTLAHPPHQDKGGAPEEYPAGTEITLNESAKLRDLARLAAHPTIVPEVEVQPLDMVKLSGGRSMWTYRVRFNNKSHRPRTGMERIGSHAAQAALPPMKEEKEDIPF